MDVVLKATGTVTPVEDSRSKHGEFDVILSTSALDRDGDELYPDEWKTPLPERITFDSDHGMSVATCVGSGKPFINDDGQLQVRGTFASTPHGQAVRTLVNEGHIDSVSVAFRNMPKSEKSGKPLRELLNGAFVAVPANVEARVLSSKAAKDDDSKKDASNWQANQMNAVGDMFENDPLDGGDQTQRKAYWQGIHDVAVKLGAGCPYSDPQAVPDVLQSSNRGITGRTGDRIDGIINVVTKAAAEPCNCDCAGCTCPSMDKPAEKAYTLDEWFELQRHLWETTKSLPSKSADDSAAADQKSAAADESADDVALLGKSLAIRLGFIDS